MHVPARGKERRFQGLAAGLGLGALTFAVYANSLGAGMVLDNKGLLLQDPRIREATGKNLGLILAHTYWWPSGEAGLYRPLTTLSYLFNHAVLGGGEQAAGYHLVNLALHTINVLLVFAVGRRLLGQVGPAAWLAGLWAVYPASTESVTNIVGRPDLLAAMATLGGLLMYVKSTMEGARRVAWLAGLGVVTAAGVAAKESAVTIVAVIALYELAGLGRRRWGDLRWGWLATGIPIAGMLALRAAVLAGSPAAQFPFTDNPIADAGFWTGRLTALKVMGQYLGQAVWPWRLAIDYSYAQIPLGIGSAGDGLAVAAALAAAAGLAGLWRWNRRALFLAGFAVLVFLPMSNLLVPIGAIRADRFLYLPAVGVLGCVVLAAGGLGSRMRRPLVAPAILAAMTAGFAARTWARNAEWRDELTLARADVETSPRSFKLHRLLALGMFEADPGHADIDQVVEEIERSMAIVDALPDARNVPETYYLAGAVYLEKGDRLHTAGGADGETFYRRAREVLERCIRINEAQERREGQGVGRTKADAYRLLAGAYERLGDMDGAFRAAREGLRLAPRDPQMYSLVANLLLLHDQGNEAAVILTEGMLITSDAELRASLVRLYGSSADPENCTLMAGADGPAINARCQIVADHVCAAAPDVLKALTDMGRREEAMEKKQMFLREYRCEPGRLSGVPP